MKTIIKKLGILEKNKPDLKPIVVKMILDDCLDMTTDHSLKDLTTEKYVTLLCMNYTSEGADLFLVHATKNPSDDPENTVLCIGKWNDGVV
jgi:hypothetical protein